MPDTLQYAIAFCNSAFEYVDLWTNVTYIYL